MTKYRPLPLRCGCGGNLTRFIAVGLATDHQLEVHCWCPGCEKVVRILKPLADCWRDCPKQSDRSSVEPIEPNGGYRYQIQDSALLHSMGISLSDYTRLPRGSPSRYWRGWLANALHRRTVRQ